MKIFFLTQYAVELYKPILVEMQKQGHDVFLQRDVSLSYDWKHRHTKGIKKFILWGVSHITRTPQRYWKKMIQSSEHYNKIYDLFFCIDGVSFHPFLLNHLKRLNPSIHSVLYLWDSNSFYDFFISAKYFDRVYTFDLKDAESNKSFRLLPSYWIETPKRPIKYSLCMVGSDHDRRLEIVSKIYNQLDESLLPSCLRVVITRPSHYSGLRHLLFKKRYIKELSEFEKKRHNPCATEEKQTIESILHEIDESICVLDTDMPVQTGATQRVIWALAKGKKVLSTNLNLSKMPFYNSEQIKFIDRDNPVIDKDFLNHESKFPINQALEKLRIDKWVHTVIDFD